MLKLLVFSLLVVLGSGLAPLKTAAQDSCPTDADVDTLLGQGLDAYAAADYEAAIDAYTCVINTDPATVDAYIGRSDAYLLNGNWEAALLDHIMADSYFDYSTVSYPEAMEQRANEMIETSPDAVDGYMRRAMFLWLNARDDEALADYERILELDPDNAFALAFRGSSNIWLGDSEAAQEDWARVAELEPDNAEIYLRMATTLFYAGETEAAFEQFERALEIDPEAGEVYYERGRVRAAAGDYEAAIADLERALELGVSSVVQHFANIDLALAQLEQGEEAAALESFEAAINAQPGQVNTMYIIANLIGASHPQQAAQFLIRASTIDWQEQHEVQAITIAEVLSLELAPRNVYPLTFEGDEGQIVTITATATEGDVDPVLVLLDAEGTPLVGSDDIEAGVDRNSLINEYTLPSDGTYTLMLWNTFGGEQGSVEVLVDES